MPAKAILEDDVPLELPAEDVNPEEKAPPVLVRIEELAEQLDVLPEITPFVDPTAALATKAGGADVIRTLDGGTPRSVVQHETGGDIRKADRGIPSAGRTSIPPVPSGKPTVPEDVLEKLKIFPHAALAMSEVSSANATGGTYSEPTTGGSDQESMPDLVDDSDFDDDEWVSGYSVRHEHSDSESDPGPEVELTVPVATEDLEAETEEVFDHEEVKTKKLTRKEKRARKVTFQDEAKKKALEEVKPKKLTRKEKRAFRRACAVINNASGEPGNLPSELIHELMVEGSSELDPGARTVTAAEVRASTGKTAEGWRAATEKEFVENFQQRNVFTVTTEEERRAYGAPLPMKLVYTMKGGKFKVRAVVCGNFENVDPTQALWTAQAETSSLVAALRLSLLRKWKVGAIDVSGAFMYAPLPQHMLVVVKPPQAFVDLGLANPGEFWTLHRAVYGLKVSPRAWGTSRDKTVREMRWSTDGHQYRLQQCDSDTQVWRLTHSGGCPREDIRTDGCLCG